MAEVHPTAMVAKGADLAEGVVIGPYCIVGEGVKLGRNVRLTSHVVVEGVTGAEGAALGEQDPRRSRSRDQCGGTRPDSLENVDALA